MTIEPTVESGRGAPGAFLSFLQALQFMTVLPLRNATRFDEDWINAAARFFPLVGALIGLVSAAVLWGAGHVWSGPVPAGLALTASVMLTGALHEDGLADTADGLLGGRDRARRIAILKDSRIGTYGAAALALTFGLRAAALVAMPGATAAAALIAAHALGRAAQLVVMAALPYGGDVAASRTVYPKQRFSLASIVIAIAFSALALAPLAYVAPLNAAAALALAGLLAAIPPLAAARLIGGYTGDILGATDQMVEIGVLLAAAAAL